MLLWVFMSVQLFSDKLFTTDYWISQYVLISLEFMLYLTWGPLLLFQTSETCCHYTFLPFFAVSLVSKYFMTCYSIHSIFRTTWLYSIHKMDLLQNSTKTSIKVACSSWGALLWYPIFAKKLSPLVNFVPLCVYHESFVKIFCYCFAKSDNFILFEGLKAHE